MHSITSNPVDKNGVELPILVLPVGLPQSGKSTWAKKQTIPIVNPDSIRLALHGEAFLKEAEPMVWVMARYMVKSLFLAGHNTVILDATNYNKKFRDDWYNPTNWECRFKMFNTPTEVCIERAIRNGKDYLVPVIEMMNSGFEPLTPLESYNIYQD